MSSRLPGASPLLSFALEAAVVLWEQAGEPLSVISPMRSLGFYSVCDFQNSKAKDHACTFYKIPICHSKDGGWGMGELGCGGNQMVPKKEPRWADLVMNVLHISLDLGPWNSYLIIHNRQLFLFRF